MRISLLLIFVTLGACSSSNEQRADAPDSEYTVSACVTEEVLREANASEEEIRQFREDEAKAKAANEATCG